MKLVTKTSAEIKLDWEDRRAIDSIVSHIKRAVPGSTIAEESLFNLVQELVTTAFARGRLYERNLQ